MYQSDLLPKYCLIIHPLTYDGEIIIRIDTLSGIIKISKKNLWKTDFLLDDVIVKGDIDIGYRKYSISFDNNAGHYIQQPLPSKIPNYGGIHEYIDMLENAFVKSPDKRSVDFYHYRFVLGREEAIYISEFAGYTPRLDEKSVHGQSLKQIISKILNHLSDMTREYYENHCFGFMMKN